MNEGGPAHTNRLIHSTSPYLLQHAHNPVDWHPWGEEALARSPPGLSVGAEEIRKAVAQLARDFDERWGGFGRAPKFPPAAGLSLLLRAHRRFGDTEAMRMATRTLEKMARGGMRDQIGGGFHRYSVDEQWLVPHFEKMLYDNALLAPVYLHAWVVTGNGRYREIVEETLDYMLRELRLPEGGFASAQDADTDGVEGLTYTWTAEEGAPADLLEPFEHGRSLVRGELDPE